MTGDPLTHRATCTVGRRLGRALKALLPIVSEPSPDKGLHWSPSSILKIPTLPAPPAASPNTRLRDEAWHPMSTPELRGADAGGSAIATPSSDSTAALQRVNKGRVEGQVSGIIVRPLPAGEAALSFVEWVIEMGLEGERTWSEVWALYNEWYCPEHNLIALPDNVFAHALKSYCHKRQFRAREGGKARRLTTYCIVDSGKPKVEDKKSAAAAPECPMWKQVSLRQR